MNTYRHIFINGEWIEDKRDKYTYHDQDQLIPEAKDMLECYLNTIKTISNVYFNLSKNKFHI